MRILNADDVYRSLAMGEAIESMKRAFAALSAGRCRVPPRAHLSIEPHHGVTLVMPALVDDDGAPTLAVKVISLFERNAARNLARIQAAVDSFVAEMAGRGPIPADLRAAAGPQEALAGADVVCAIPEPSTFALAALGLLGLGFFGRRRRSR